MGIVKRESYWTIMDNNGQYRDIWGEILDKISCNYYYFSERFNNSGAIVELGGGEMTAVKDANIKKLSTTKREFLSALRKVGQRIEKPKASSKR